MCPGQAIGEQSGDLDALAANLRTMRLRHDGQGLEAEVGAHVRVRHARGARAGWGKGRQPLPRPGAMAGLAGAAVNASPSGRSR